MTMTYTHNARLFCIFIVGVLIAGVGCVRLTIEPRRAVVRPGDNTYVICKTPPGTELESCKFFITGIPEIDLSKGRRSQATDEYAYYGRGLEMGQCGINLLRVARTCVTLSKIRTVTCAVKVKGGGWSVAYMSLLVTDEPTFPLNAEQPKVETKVGANVTIVCQSASISLKSCFFEGRNLGRIDLTQGHTGVAGRVHYFGQGLEEGECGIRLTGVREDWNGLVWCAAKSEHGSWGYDYVVLEVAKPPLPPVLKLSSTDLKLNETLTATCTTKGSRPLARMLWDAPFDRGVTDLPSAELSDAALDFEERTVAQTMTTTVTQTDHLKNVRCVVRYNNNQNEVVATAPVKVRFCGRRNFRDATPLVSNGVLAKYGEFPWHVGVYKKINSQHKYICGGSLISTKHVISAAHCFWNAVYSRADDASAYSVAANKFHRSWSDDAFSQRLDVAELKLHARYQDDRRRYEDDIAVMVLEGEVVFSAEVHPICLDWSLAYEESWRAPDRHGTIPGWGFTENATLSDQLRYVELPFMEKPRCAEVVPTDFQLFLTPDKFCAGFVNRSTSVCSGDSGGGLVFSQNTTTPYYLLGIASLAPKAQSGRCNSQQVSEFTEVSSYYSWIRRILDSDDVDHVKHNTV